MNEDVLNNSIRKFLKTVGVTSQREIEKAVREGPLLEVVAEVPWRAPTKFERRGVDAGRPPYDLAAVRRARS